MRGNLHIDFIIKMIPYEFDIAMQLYKRADLKMAKPLTDRPSFHQCALPWRPCPKTGFYIYHDFLISRRYGIVTVNDNAIVIIYLYANMIL